ncbi:MAG: hypothetical protein P4M11_09030 [Candidatus Pacebacteria bacterium]|nr:hypothetical protein [Candidatus Paceibacterota bacterium]
MLYGPGKDYEEKDAQMLKSSRLFYYVSVLGWVSPLLALAATGGLWKWGIRESEYRHSDEQESTTSY